jgi:hypothetical protein
MTDISDFDPSRHCDQAALVTALVIKIFRDTFVAWFRGDPVDLHGTGNAVETVISDALHAREQDVRAEYRDD